MQNPPRRVAVPGVPGEIANVESIEGRAFHEKYHHIGAALLLTSCSFYKQGFLAAAGPTAQAERGHFFSIIFWMLVVIIPLYVAIPIVLWKYRLGKSSTYRPRWAFSWPLEILVWGVPFGIVGILGWNLWHTAHKLDPYSPIAGYHKPALQIQAVSMDWKWLFIYPNQGVAAVNKVVFPAGRPVHFRLTSETVMQSFIISRLAGQMYTMPGMTTKQTLLASRPGTYRGENTQYNGDGFAKEKFIAHAVTPAAFKAWIEKLHQAKPPLDKAAYARLTKRSVPPAPLEFGSVRAHLFERIIAQVKAPALASTPQKQGE